MEDIGISCGLLALKAITGTARLQAFANLFSEENFSKWNYRKHCPPEEPLPFCRHVLQRPRIVNLSAVIAVMDDHVLNNLMEWSFTAWQRLL